MPCGEVISNLQPTISKSKIIKKQNSNQLSTNLVDEELDRSFNQSSNDINDNGHSSNGFFNEEDELKYGARHVIKIFIPVSLCMLIVVFTILTIPYYQRTDVYMAYTPFTDQTVETSTRVWQSFANALILITVIVIMTFILILLYKKRCYKIINGWLLLSSLSLLFLITTVHVHEIFKVLNVPVDNLTVSLFIWNFGLIGMICIHWKGPMIVQQSYLLFISSLMALTFIKFIPEWTIWTVLFAVSIWDLIAVLCPKGPLRILVETAQERNESLFPSLVYSSGIAYFLVNTVNQVRNDLGRDENQLINIQENDQQINQQANQEQQQQQSNQQQSSRILINDQNSINVMPQIIHDTSNAGDNSRQPFVTNSNSSIEEQGGVKLGLGDFVFYSILVGKVAYYGDWNTTLACFVAILIGLCVTLYLLSIIKTALPALPISITFGLIFYFSTSCVVQPFTNYLAFHQIFI